jgi:hypothetical protein
MKLSLSSIKLVANNHISDKFYVTEEVHLSQNYMNLCVTFIELDIDQDE